MGDRYYCDYCDKSFVNNPESVKKHINGLQHQSLRKTHYQQFEDPQTILDNELRKIPCKKFMEGGQCLFGANCRFSHYTKYQLDALKYQINENQRAVFKLNNDKTNSNPSIENWLVSRKKRGLSNSPVLEKLFIDKLNADENKLTDFLPLSNPTEFDNIPNLPPSLKRIQPEHFKNFKFTVWG